MSGATGQNRLTAREREREREKCVVAEAVASWHQQSTANDRSQ